MLRAYSLLAVSLVLTFFLVQVLGIFIEDIIMRHVYLPNLFNEFICGVVHFEKLEALFLSRQDFSQEFSQNPDLPYLVIIELGSV